LYRDSLAENEAAPDTDDYASVIGKYYAAVFDKDGKTLATLTAPPDYWTYYYETYDKTEQDVIDSFEEGCENTLADWKETYGDDVEVSYRISGMSQQGQDGIDEWNENMEELLGNDGADMTESVTLQVELTFTGSVKTGTEDISPVLGKIDGTWYLVSEGSADSTESE
jgi:hypothetical protein